MLKRELLELSKLMLASEDPTPYLESMTKVCEDSFKEKYKKKVITTIIDNVYSIDTHALHKLVEEIAEVFK